MIKIIIADDHAGMREAWRSILDAQEGLTVSAVCRSGDEVLESATSLIPDIVLMDINMSPMNGFEATSLLLEKHPSIHVIGISINAEPSYAHKMLSLGAKGFITKSSHPDEMVTGIREVKAGKVFLCQEIRSKIKT